MASETKRIHICIVGAGPRGLSVLERISANATAHRDIDVVVPTYRRPELLRECRAALARQRHPAGRVVVAVRSDDDEARRVLRESEVALNRIAFKNEVIADLLNGVLSFEDAAIRFARINRELSPDAHFFRLYPGRSLEEQSAWQLVAHLKASRLPGSMEN